MKHPLRSLALALALAATPACAALGVRPLENPVAAARSLDQRAYAVMLSYAAMLEEAGDIARDPAVPRAMKVALGRAEAAATPPVEALGAALALYRQAPQSPEAAHTLEQSLIAAEAALLALQAQLQSAQGGR